MKEQARGSQREFPAFFIFTTVAELSHLEFENA
jgi:hypothetical protein